MSEKKNDDLGADAAAVVQGMAPSPTDPASDWRQMLAATESKRAAEIFAAVEAACEKAQKLRRKDRKRFDEAVNWADLGCAGVEVCACYYAEDGWDFSYSAHIEEASPDCRELPEFVRQELVSAGFPNVSVMTEW